MDKFQRTRETGLCLWSGKKKGHFSCFEAGLWEVGGGEGGGRRPLWGPRRPRLPMCLNLACGSAGPRKTQTCTNVAQAKYWKEKSSDILYKLQKIKAINCKRRWDFPDGGTVISQSHFRSPRIYPQRNLTVYCGVTFMIHISSSQLISL